MMRQNEIKASDICVGAVINSNGSAFIVRSVVRNFYYAYSWATGKTEGR